MDYNFIILKDEIDEQLASIRQLEDTLHEVQNKDLNDEITRRVYASILEDFYMAVEKIFKLLASDIDNNLPDGARWHKKLLRQMSVKIPEIRPAVIDKELFNTLEEYLKFRHLTHNIYGFQLEYERFNHLVENLPQTIEQLEKQINNFLTELEKLLNDNEKNNVDDN